MPTPLVPPFFYVPAAPSLPLPPVAPIPGAGLWTHALPASTAPSVPAVTAPALPLTVWPGMPLAATHPMAAPPTAYPSVASVLDWRVEPRPPTGLDRNAVGPVLAVGTEAGAIPRDPAMGGGFSTGGRIGPTGGFTTGGRIGPNGFTTGGGMRRGEGGFTSGGGMGRPYPGGVAGGYTSGGGMQRSGFTSGGGFGFVTDGGAGDEFFYQPRRVIADPPGAPAIPFAEAYPAELFEWDGDQLYLRTPGGRTLAYDPAAGRMLYDPDGRPIDPGAIVVGRGTFGAADVPLNPYDAAIVTEHTTGYRPLFGGITGGQTMYMPAGTDMSRYGGTPGRRFQVFDPEGTAMLLRSRHYAATDGTGTNPYNYEAHEVAHTIAQVVGAPSRSHMTDFGPVTIRTIDLHNFTEDMEQIYDVLNNPDRPTGRLDFADYDGYLPGPPTDHYDTPEKVFEELVAESVRAYLLDPNFIKTVAPDLAAAIREVVNSHPELSRFIHLASNDGYVDPVA